MVAGTRSGKTSDKQRSAARADLGPGLGHLTPPSGRTENMQGIFFLISLITRDESQETYLLARLGKLAGKEYHKKEL